MSAKIFTEVMYQNFMIDLSNLLKKYEVAGAIIITETLSNKLSLSVQVVDSPLYNKERIEGLFESIKSTLALPPYGNIKPAGTVEGHIYPSSNEMPH